MANDVFKTELSVVKVSNLLSNYVEGELLLKKEYNLSDDKHINILVFQRYSLRNNSSMGLVVTIDNIKGDNTTVEVVSTGSGGGIFNIDWGSGSSYVNSVRDILENHKDFY